MAGHNQPGSPYIEIPDGTRDEDDGSIFTFCWLDHNRGCSGGCEAFDNAHAGDETGTWSSCRFVNLFHVIGHSVVNLLNAHNRSNRAVGDRVVPGQDIPPPGTGL